MADLQMRFPGGLSKALTLSYDDGVEQDARLLDIMERHGLKGTFNLNSGMFALEGTVYPAGQIHRRMTERQALALFAHSGQEVAIHGYEHGNFATLPAAQSLWQTMRDKEKLERLFGRIIRGMAYPYGAYSRELAQALKTCGVAYARTVESSHGFDIPTDWLTLPPTCHHTEPECMPLAKAFAQSKPYRAQLFYLWGHSYEFERDNNWELMEELAALMGGREDIWYATNIQIRDYVEAWRGMHSSADGRRLYNPGVMPLWLLFDGEMHCIEGGEELVL